VGLLDRLNAGTAAASGTGADAHAQTVARYRGLLLHEIDLGELSKLDAGQRRLRLERVMGHLLSREGPILSSGERQAIIRRVVDEALGLGILEPLLADPSVTEIMVNGHETIFVERAGVLQRLDAHFANEDQLMQTIDRIVAGVNRRVDESSPMVDARLSSGERVNVIVPPLALDGPMLTIRRFPRAYSLAELVDKGAMDEPTALLLGSFVRARCNVIVSGGTGTGKTTMLNALSGFIPGHERIVTIEDAAELRLQQEHVIRLESRPPNVEGKGQVTIRDLVRNSLRMRPDRIIVGEVRGGETLDMLQAMNTGHEGSMATVHANSSDDAMMRLETLASMSEISIPYEALRDQINNAVDVVVQLSRQADGSRKVTEVAAVSSRRREDFALATVAAYRAQPLAADRVVRGAFEQHPLPAALAERLMLAGETLPHPFRGAEHPGELMIRRAL
jgi:pilus assembly protein CpaF